MTRFTDHDGYLASRPADQRAALEHLRRVIAGAAPGAVEVISYGIPAFRDGPKGKVLCGYAGMARHCGVYLFDGGALAGFAGRLGGWSVSKGTIRFTPDRPLPDALVAEIVAARREGGR